MPHAHTRTYTEQMQEILLRAGGAAWGGMALQIFKRVKEDVYVDVDVYVSVYAKEKNDGLLVYSCCEVIYLK